MISDLVCKGFKTFKVLVLVDANISFLTVPSVPPVNKSNDTFWMFLVTDR